MEETGRNRTPDKLASGEQIRLAEVCDQHLRRVLQVLEPDWAVGIGKYAEACLRRVGPSGATIGSILHPSPASPLANRDWAGTVTAALVGSGVW